MISCNSGGTYIAKAILGFSLNRDLVRNRFIKRIQDEDDSREVGLSKEILEDI